MAHRSSRGRTARRSGAANRLESFSNDIYSIPDVYSITKLPTAAARVFFTIKSRTETLSYSETEFCLTPISGTGTARLLGVSQVAFKFARTVSSRTYIALPESKSTGLRHL